MFDLWPCITVLCINIINICQKETLSAHTGPCLYWVLGLLFEQFEAVCEVTCDLWPWNVFHSWVIHLHFLWVVTVLYSIYPSSSKCLDSVLHWTKHSQSAFSDIHQSNSVSLRDQVNFMLSLTVTELARITFFSYIIWRHINSGNSLNKSISLHECSYFIKALGLCFNRICK